MTRSDAILLVGHGSVTDTSDVPAFLRRIRRGREPTPELVREVVRRHEKVGGSPLLDITDRQALALENATGLRVLVAMRMWRPFIRDVLADAVDSGVKRLCVLPTAPFSVHVYAEATKQALDGVPGGERLELVPVEPYGLGADLVEAHASAIRVHLEGRDPATTALVATAHSLPIRTLERGDPYQRQFEACAAAVAERLGWPVTVAYQSQGAGGGEWLGPTVESTLRSAKSAGRSAVVLAPIGFLADHVETLYDLDIEARDAASSLGLELVRVSALNDAPGLIDTMASVVKTALS